MRLHRARPVAVDHVKNLDARREEGSDPGLFQEFAQGCLLCRLAPLNMAARKTPESIGWRPATLHQKNFAIAPYAGACAKTRDFQSG